MSKEMAYSRSQAELLVKFYTNELKQHSWLREEYQIERTKSNLVKAKEYLARFENDKVELEDQLKYLQGVVDSGRWATDADLNYVYTTLIATISNKLKGVK